MRERLIVGPIMAVYRWLRDYEPRTPADLRFEARMWTFAGQRDVARLCRLRAEALEHPSAHAYGRTVRAMDRVDVAVSVGTIVVLTVTVLYVTGQLVRWAL